MSLLDHEYAARLAHWERTLLQDLYHPLETIHFSAFATERHLTPEEALRHSFTSIEEGTAWGPSMTYLWLKATIVIPESAQGQIVTMSLAPGGEATLFVNGQAFGTHRADWVSMAHHYISDNILTEQAVPGQRFELLAEVYAGHDFPGTATGPLLGGIHPQEDPALTRKRLGHSTFGVWNEDAYQLWLDVTTLHQLMNELPEDTLRAVKIAEGLENFTNAVDFEQPLEGRIADYRKARELLRPLMESANGDTAAQMWLVGNAHLDLAWLWPMRETHRKTARTFAAQLRLLDKYPEYRFIQSQPASYEMCQQHYPELFDRIRAAAKEGRWIADGAMYVEPDTNMPSGEALIRQIFYGKQYYREVFGVESRLLWLPDTFGYTAALPQILKGCGVDYLVTQKIFWCYNVDQPFPYHYFTWKGMDGSSVTSFLPTSYTYRTDPSELCQAWRKRVQKRNLDAFLIPFGYGDGGGGPCRDHIEHALRERDLEGMARVKIASPMEFFEEMERRGGPRHTWDGELYFMAHRGTYTTQAALKNNNRRSEFALHDMEVWGALAALQGHAWSQETADRLWKTLLLNQFHDILPGSSIAQVYIEANAQHRALQQEAEAVTDAALHALPLSGDGMTLFNSLGFARTEVIALPDGEERLVTVPAFGHTSVDAAAVKDIPGCAAAAVSEAGFVLTTPDLTVCVNRAGEITSYRLGNREWTCAPMNALRLYKDIPRSYDAWDIDRNYLDQPPVAPIAEEIFISKAEGMTASVTWLGRIGHSSIRQTISVQVGSPVVTFDTTVDWHELHRLLKADFPVDVRAENALHEMQFGYVERPTHANRAPDQQQFEVCNHRYTALCDQGHGCAVLNDCKYGVSVAQNTISLTLLRAASAPELRTDQGENHFRYGFTAWEGPFLDAPVVHQGLAFNQPLRRLPGSLPTFSAFSTDRANVLPDTLKLANDGSGELILRLYESKKADTTCTLRSDLPVKAICLCDMLENPTGAWTSPDMPLHLKAFQVLTLRVKLKAAQ